MIIRDLRTQPADEKINKGYGFKQIFQYITLDSTAQNIKQYSQREAYTQIRILIGSSNKNLQIMQQGKKLLDQRKINEAIQLYSNLMQSVISSGENLLVFEFYITGILLHFLGKELFDKMPTASAILQPDNIIDEILYIYSIALRLPTILSELNVTLENSNFMEELIKSELEILFRVTYDIESYLQRFQNVIINFEILCDYLLKTQKQFNDYRLLILNHFERFTGMKTISYVRTHLTPSAEMYYQEQRMMKDVDISKLKKEFTTTNQIWSPYFTDQNYRKHFLSSTDILDRKILEKAQFDFSKEDDNPFVAARMSSYFVGGYERIKKIERMLYIHLKMTSIKDLELRKTYFILNYKLIDHESQLFDLQNALHTYSQYLIDAATCFDKLEPLLTNNIRWENPVLKRIFLQILESYNVEESLLINECIYRIRTLHAGILCFYYFYNNYLDQKEQISSLSLFENIIKAHNVCRQTLIRFLKHSINSTPQEFQFHQQATIQIEHYQQHQEHWTNNDVIVDELETLLCSAKLENKQNTFSAANSRLNAVQLKMREKLEKKIREKSQTSKKSQTEESKDIAAQQRSDKVYAELIKNKKKKKKKKKITQIQAVNASVEVKQEIKTIIRNPLNQPSILVKQFNNAVGLMNLSTLSEERLEAAIHDFSLIISKVRNTKVNEEKIVLAKSIACLGECYMLSGSLRIKNNQDLCEIVPLFDQAIHHLKHAMEIADKINIEANYSEKLILSLIMPIDMALMEVISLADELNTTIEAKVKAAEEELQELELGKLNAKKRYRDANIEWHKNKRWEERSDAAKRNQMLREMLASIRSMQWTFNAMRKHKKVYYIANAKTAIAKEPEQPLESKEIAVINTVPNLPPTPRYQPEFHGYQISIPHELVTIMKLIESKSNARVYLCGSFVMLAMANLLYEKNQSAGPILPDNFRINDYDLVTNLSSKDLEILFPGCWHLQALSAHGIEVYRMFVANFKLDIVIDPAIADEDTLIANAEKRYVTIKSMHANKDGFVLTHGFLHDLTTKTLRMHGNPMELMRNDPIKIFCMIDTASRTKFLIPADISLAMTLNSSLLLDNETYLLHTWMKRLMVAPYVLDNFTHLRAFGIMPLLFPQMNAGIESHTDWLVNEFKRLDQASGEMLNHVYLMMIISHLEHSGKLEQVSQSNNNIKMIYETILTSPLVYMHFSKVESNNLNKIIDIVLHRYLSAKAAQCISQYTNNMQQYSHLTLFKGTIEKNSRGEDAHMYRHAHGID